MNIVCYIFPKVTYNIYRSRFTKIKVASACNFLINSSTIDCLVRSITLWLEQFNRLSSIIDYVEEAFYNRLSLDNRLCLSFFIIFLSSLLQAPYSLFSVPASYCMLNPAKSQQIHCKCDHCVIKSFKTQTCIKLETQGFLSAFTISKHVIFMQILTLITDHQLD